ncbi:MAG: arsenate reductase ArsC [Thermoanaerobaculia bacterium]
MGNPQILVLCTGNSARSQMAAAYLRRDAGDTFDVYSAGTEPAPEVHPLARRVLLEEGLELGDEHPKDYRQYLGHLAPRVLIIVCDGAAKSCPAVWPGVVERLLWPFEDPAAADGGEEERLAVFRRVRDEIADRVRSWVAARSPERASA